MTETSDHFQKVFPDQQAIARFQDSLIAWFEESGKTYPWRETTDPYAILVSELMLQQTQIATVLGRGYYTRWMRLFPDWETLSQADEASLLKAWEGLGYYNRARNLQRAAAEILSRFRGQCPSDLESLLSLPGVGRYTAGAVRSFAFDLSAPLVDGNVARVFSRLFGYEEPIDSTTAVKHLWRWADGLVPDSRVRQYNAALMELGQLICGRGEPTCQSCPVADHCVAGPQGIASRLPVKGKKQETTKRTELASLIVSGGRIFLTPEAGARRKGLWRLPEIEPSDAADFTELFRFDYAITRYRVDLRVYEVPDFVINRAEQWQEGEWFSLSDADALPALGSPYQKAITKYLDQKNGLL